MISGLHHFELCVSNGLKTLKDFTHKYQFVLKWFRETPSCKQWTVSMSRHNVLPAFIITEKKNEHVPSKEEWTNFCCGHSKHNQDTFFNVALQVNDIEKCTERALNNGGQIVTEPRKISDQHGSISYSTVSSCCGNIFHTLINRNDYAPTQFLPHFFNVTENISKIYNEHGESHITGIDHVSYVCRQGESSQILDWYSNVFGMKRFLVNSEETVQDGMVIDDTVGMRLKAMEYWRCAESGVRSKCNDGSTFKFVIAESLGKYENCHVNSFLKNHGGPGIQHVAIESSDICKTVKLMYDHDVPFRYPPTRYYTLPGKVSEMQDSGANVNELKKYGILLDSEESEDSRYLLQIFTESIFKEDTFFFEVIQRKGATGFGAGNIVALAKSIEEKSKDEHSIRGGSSL